MLADDDDVKVSEVFKVDRVGEVCLRRLWGEKRGWEGVEGMGGWNARLLSGGRLFRRYLD